MPLVEDKEPIAPAPEADPNLRPDPELETFDHGAMAERILKGKEQAGFLEEIGKYAKEGFGGGQVGMAPETEQWFIDRGVFRDPKNPQPFRDGIRFWNEALIKPTPYLLDLAGRAWGAGFRGGGAFLGEIAEGLTGHSNAVRGMADAGSATGEVLGAYLMGGAGSMGPHTELSRMSRDPVTGRVVDDHIGAAPQPRDFDAAARVVGQVADAKPTAMTIGKAKALYQEEGLHPAEVAAAAMRDPELAKDLASDKPTLPAKLTGFDPEASKEAFVPKTLPAGVAPELDNALKPRTTWPRTPHPRDADPTDTRTFSMSFGDRVGELFDRLGVGSYVRDLQMKFTPMAARDTLADTRAAAKDFANANRTAHYDYEQVHKVLTKEFPRDRLIEMWRAADLDSVLEQSSGLGPPPEAIKLKTLDPKEKFAVKRLQEDSLDAWEDAKRTPGLLGPDAEALPSFVPRIVIREMLGGGIETGGGKPKALRRWGENLRTTTSQLLHRKYLTAAETEAAAKERLGEGAEIVRDIRTLPLATARLRQAIAGRKYINHLKEMGELEDEGVPPLVIEGTPPKALAPAYFTIPEHPASYTYKPRLEERNGRWQTALNEDGEPIFDRVPVYIRKDAEGPTRAILTEPEGEIYKGLMAFKSKSMNMIMFSPLIHNAVIFGRQVPATVGKTSFKNPFSYFKIYFDGNKVRGDKETMREAVANGMVPMVRDGSSMDIRSIVTDPSLTPGRSITSRVLAWVPDLFDKKAGDAVKRSVDKAGDFWHNTLLWDRVADLQAGLYKSMRDDAIKKGIHPEAAKKLGAHLANRYAGVLSPEAMSPMARKIANLTLFSRSYTLGNVGALKDMFVGLPRDVLSQIERDQGIEELAKVRSYAQRKAIGIVAIDVALFYAGISLLQSGFQALRNDETLNDVAKDYVDRFWKTLNTVEEHPFNALNPFWMVNSLMMQGGNEPGRTDRALRGYNSDGTAEYMRLTVGRTGGEMAGWLTEPVQMVKNKLSPILKPLIENFNGEDALGRRITNPYAETTEEQLRNVWRMVWHFMLAQVPNDVMAAAADLAFSNPSAEERALDWERIKGGTLGFQYSRGYPGGPEGGWANMDKKEKEFLAQQASPEARSLIRRGDIAGAKKLMRDAKMDEQRQQWVIDTTHNPRRRFQSKTFQQYINSLSPEEREKVEKK